MSRSQGEVCQLRFLPATPMLTMSPPCPALRECVLLASELGHLPPPMLTMTPLAVRSSSSQIHSCHIHADYYAVVSHSQTFVRDIRFLAATPMLSTMLPWSAPREKCVISALRPACTDHDATVTPSQLILALSTALPTFAADAMRWLMGNGKGLWAKWDKYSLDLFVEYVFEDVSSSDGSYTTPSLRKDEESSPYTCLAHTIEPPQFVCRTECHDGKQGVHVLWAEVEEFMCVHSPDILDAAEHRITTQHTIKGAGYLVPQETPDGLADRLNEVLGVTGRVTNRAFAKAAKGAGHQEMDHHARSASRNSSKQVVGVLLGQDNGKTVHVADSFGIPFEEDEKDSKTWFLEHNYVDV
ncbi:hypothetical protein PAXINDRAFT_102161 [Paxillus involutus ATCC 200175]|uniref:JAB1/MPN/MOV34 metalloenzyme domain-containing protein n=1 Tax=Paxillus involutus ATCC 200175 TaxID=664439 RepID=A0A0C9SQS8_PAXIN|nr:hypothetical protein PAXINDRAFT_102161 [Paxillus involutus ATCC 200175]